MDKLTKKKINCWPRIWYNYSYVVCCQILMLAVFDSLYAFHTSQAWSLEGAIQRTERSLPFANYLQAQICVTGLCFTVNIRYRFIWRFITGRRCVGFAYLFSLRGGSISNFKHQSPFQVRNPSFSDEVWHLTLSNGGGLKVAIQVSGLHVFGIKKAVQSAARWPGEINKWKK